jgi:hypothetical protein
MDGILPAAGFALRMKGIPKFLLPSSIFYESLIETHITNLKTICEKIWIPTRPEIVQLLHSLGFIDESTIILPTTTQTMSETIQKVLGVSKAETFFLSMPDTFYYGHEPYSQLNSEPEIADVACWKIRNEQIGKLGQVKQDSKYLIDIKDKKTDCDYEYSWGALTFSRKLEKFIDKADPHIGYALEKAVKSESKITYKNIEGEYFDCGTPDEYLALLTKLMG